MFADAAASVNASYRATFITGDDRISIYADPPRRRVDTTAPGQPDRRTISTADHTYACTHGPKKWTCQVGPPSDPPGAFRPDAVAATIAALTTPGAPPVTATHRRIAGVEARCAEAGGSVFCVAASGVPLLVSGTGGSDVRATSYRAGTPKGVFDRPDSR